ncbi:hypothetical protein [Sphingomonas sp. VNH70]|uniref:hypothetical protein n=1 Tax=Sphingomonas silueang TaxID=3156617 RepID=UPI0032B4FC43
MTSDIIEISTTAPTTNQNLNLPPPRQHSEIASAQCALGQAFRKPTSLEMVCCSRQTLIRWERDDVSPLMVLKSTRG